MRRIINLVLLGAGAFLLAAACIASFWAADKVERTPLDTDSVTRLDGTAVKLGESFDVRVASFTQADADVSDDDVIAFVNNTCVVKDIPDTPDCGEEGTGKNADPNVVTISKDVFATDRRTAESVENGDYVPAGTVQHEGLVNKWPFHAKKTDYTYWDGVLGKAVPATFEGVEDIDGLETYRYHVVVDKEAAEVVPDTEGFYSQDKTIWIDPVTGAIVDQTQHEVRETDKDVLIDLEVSFTDDQVAANVADARSNGDKLTLISSTVPKVGFILGPILLLLGAIGTVTRRRSARAQA